MRSSVYLLILTYIGIHMNMHEDSSPVPYVYQHCQCSVAIFRLPLTVLKLINVEKKIHQFKRDVIDD